MRIAECSRKPHPGDPSVQVASRHEVRTKSRVCATNNLYQLEGIKSLVSNREADSYHKGNRPLGIVIEPGSMAITTSTICCTWTADGDGAIYIGYPFTMCTTRDVDCCRVNGHAVLLRRLERSRKLECATHTTQASRSTKTTRDHSLAN